MNRSYPHIVLIHTKNNNGFVFTYITLEDFKRSIDLYVAPIKSVMEQRKTTNVLEDSQVQLISSVNFLTDTINGKLEKHYDRMAVRIAAAACIEVTPWKNNKIPKIVSIELQNNKLVIQDGKEILHADHYPRAIVIGTPKEGGGVAHFFDNYQQYNKASKQPITENFWLPQVVFKTYKKLPPVIFARPTEDLQTNKVNLMLIPYNFNKKYPIEEY